MAKVPDHLLVQHYELKATFVANQLESVDYLALFQSISDFLSSTSLKFEKKELLALNIDRDAFDNVVKSGLNPLGFFLHPDLIASNPAFLKHFRCLSVFSQKGLTAISKVSGIKEIEGGRSVSPENSLKIAKVINRNLSALARAAAPSVQKIQSLIYATAGITADGSWKNQVGAEGERVIKSLLVRESKINGELKSLTLQDGQVVLASDVTPDWIDKNAGNFREIIFANASSARFGSEPDVTLFDKDNRILAGIEVKAGLDPAAALERLGAMLKSFDSISTQAPSAERILVVACLTEEVEKRLQSMKSVTRHYSLTDIMEPTSKVGAQFSNMVRGVLGLVVAKM
jgi:hypothetical protein